MDSNKIQNVLTILSDNAKQQRIAITCRCGTRWTELIPGELHESQLIVRFTCIKCGQKYDLHQKQLHRVFKEDDGARGQTITNNQPKYDA